MGAIWFLAKNDLKKQRGDMGILFALILLSTFLMFSSLSILTGLPDVLDTTKEEISGADYYLFYSRGFEREIEEIFNDRPEIGAYESEPCLYLVSDYRNPAETDEWSNFEFYVMSFEEQGSIQTTAAEYTDLGEKEIVLPYYMKREFPVGSTFEMKGTDTVHAFTAAGYTKDPYFATPLNISVYLILTSDSAIEALENDFNGIPMTAYQAVGETIGTSDFEAVIGEDIRKMAEGNPAQNVSYVALNWQNMKGGASYMSQISMAIILTFSLLILLVSMVIIAFTIRNYMERNMKNTGVLKASGYTVRQLRLSTLLQMELVAIFGAICGILAGIFGAQAVGGVESLILGLPWNQGFLVAPAMLTVAVILALVALVVLCASRSYRKLSVLDALRGGIHTHNFKENRLPLSDTHLPLPLALSMKEIFGAKRRHLALLLITALLSVATLIGFGMYDSFGRDQEMILKIAGIEGGDANIAAAAGNGERIVDWAESDTVLTWTVYTLRVRNRENEVQVQCTAYEDPALLRYEELVEGRLPQYDNEIVLTTNTAEELGVSIGDLVYIEGTSGPLDYLVCGIDQKISNMGHMTVLTLSGGERLFGAPKEEMYRVYLTDGYTYEDLEERVHAELPDATIENVSVVIGETTSTVANAMKLICIILVSVTAFVVIFVETLLIRSKLIRERQSFGISKALGFTDRQLLIQTMISNLPTIAVGAVLGILLAPTAGNAVMIASMSVFGLRKASVMIGPLWSTLTFVGIVLLAALTSLLSALSIRKLRPVELLSSGE